MALCVSLKPWDRHSSVPIIPIQSPISARARVSKLTGDIGVKNLADYFRRERRGKLK